MTGQTTPLHTSYILSNAKKEGYARKQNPIVELMRFLQSVEIDSEEAKMNETTMVNVYGERVKY
ncbi:MAG TPA: hypothetical protein VNZ45_14045 [Bacteroidia bacterium]|nr:hypothetical protein [Bacteroidia bacterium]